MKKKTFSVILICALLAASHVNILAETVADTLKLTINGTGNSASFTVNPASLPNNLPISITAPNGFTVSPVTIPADAGKTKVTATYVGSRKATNGTFVLRSGDVRSYVKVQATGTPLPSKDLSSNPVYKGGSDVSFEKTAKDGFKPNGGYTVEFKVKTEEEQEFYPYLVDSNGNGFKGYATSTGTGVYSSTSKTELTNPSTDAAGGLEKFYNDDNQFHTYRYAVTADNRVFIFRDGLPIDTLRLADLQPQSDFATETGDPVENLLRNPGFEGEYDLMDGSTIAKAVEGWHIAILDRWNSEQFIVPQEISNEQDFNNHIFRIRPYMWASGWGNGQLIQVVDVAPNESYTLTVLARGGIQEKENKITGIIILQEMDDRTKKVETTVGSNTWETYSLDYTTSANCRQLRVIFQVGSAPRGASVIPLEVDNAKLTGVSRLYSPKIGFENKQATVEYFTYDLSGAYAPIQPKITLIP
jgi:hypothetical protein